MMRIGKAFMEWVGRFELFHGGASRNRRGLEQFHERESRGVQPERPDPYYVRLSRGKASYEWLVTEVASLYGTMEWPGWNTLEEEYRDRPWIIDKIRERVRVRQGQIDQQVPQPTIVDLSLEQTDNDDFNFVGDPEATPRSELDEAVAEAESYVETHDVVNDETYVAMKNARPCPKEQT